MCAKSVLDAAVPMLQAHSTVLYQVLYSRYTGCVL